MTDELRRFARTLVQRLGETPGGPHRAVTVEEIRSRLLPYRAYRSVLGFESVEDYDVMVMRLVGEEGGFVRTLPQLAAERCRAETESPAPNPDLLDQLADVTIQIGAEALARILEQVPERPATAPVRDDLEIIERHLELEVREPVEVKPARSTPPAPLSTPSPPVLRPTPEPLLRPAPEPRPAPAPEPRPVPVPEPRPTPAPVPPPREPEPAPPPVPTAEPVPPPAPEPRPAPAPKPQLKPRRPIVPPKAAAAPVVQDPPPPPPPPAPAPPPPPEITAPLPEPLRPPIAELPPPIPEAGPPAPAAAGTCRSCRQHFPGGRQVIFCPWCGARNAPFTCPKCNTELEPQWKHCITCGSPVKDI